MSKQFLRSVILFGTLFEIATLSVTAGAQTTAPYEWTWMGGSSAGTAGQSEVSGTLGVFAPGNIPGGLRSSASTWTDKNGKLWLFGAGGNEGGGANELWEFDPSTNEWAKMGPLIPNDGTAPQKGGLYGTLGTPSPYNTPGWRSGAASWTDSIGNFWLFGGGGYDDNNNSGNLNDLWEFNPSTNEWTWMGGSRFLTGCGSLGTSCGVPGVYGTLGVPAAGNIPGGRSGASTWTDKSGNFWLFGGSGYDGNGKYGNFTDLWEFNPSTNEWTWIGGPSTASMSAPGVYGSLGVPAPGNIPGTRLNPVSWTDKNGNFWLFGGSGGSSTLNELWVFYPASHEWAWMGGTNALTCGYPCTVTGVYGTLGTPAAGNIPGPRWSAFGWTDGDGNLWLFGGYGAGGNEVYGSPVEGYLNDLWEFNPSTNEWAWMGGSNWVPSTYISYNGGLSSYSVNGQSGVYGTVETPNTGNVPGGRETAATWTDKAGNFWLFGGYGYDASESLLDLNDLWVYQPSTGSLPVAGTPVFSVQAGTYSTIQTVEISDASNGTTIYYTTDGSMPTTSSNVYSGPVTFSSTETLKAIATASGCLTSSVASATYTVTSLTYALPVISSLSPAFAAETGPAFALTVSGSGFTKSSTVYWGGSALPTQAVSSTQLAAQVPAADVLSPGITAITVQNPKPGGGTSSALQFEVDSAFPGSITPPSFNPSSATVAAGSTASYQVSLPSYATGVSASCLNLPAGAACSYSSATGAVTITTSGTTPSGTYQVTVVFAETVPTTATADILLPFLLLPLLFLRKRLAARGVLLSACAGVVLAFSAFCMGCGGGGGGSGSSSVTQTTLTHQLTSSGAVSLTVK